MKKQSIYFLVIIILLVQTSPKFLFVLVMLNNA